VLRGESLDGSLGRRLAGRKLALGPDGRHLQVEARAPVGGGNARDLVEDQLEHTQQLGGGAACGHHQRLAGPQAEPLPLARAAERLEEDLGLQLVGAGRDARPLATGRLAVQEQRHPGDLHVRRQPAQGVVHGEGDAPVGDGGLGIALVLGEVELAAHAQVERALLPPALQRAQRLMPLAQAQQAVRLAQQRPAAQPLVPAHALGRADLAVVPERSAERALAEAGIGAGDAALGAASGDS
jgi:hypothetical protein